VNNEIYNDGVVDIARVFQWIMVDIRMAARETALSRFKQVFEYYLIRATSEEREKIATELSRNMKLRARLVHELQNQEPRWEDVAPSNAYFACSDPDRDLILSGDFDAGILDENYYIDIVGAENAAALRTLLTKMGVAIYPRIMSRKCGPRKPNVPFEFKVPSPPRRKEEQFITLEIRGVTATLSDICAKGESTEERMTLSQALWRVLAKVVKIETEEGWTNELPQPVAGSSRTILSGIHECFNRKQQRESFDSPQLFELRNKKKWLRTRDGRWVAPCEITMAELDGSYVRQDAKELIALLTFKPDEASVSMDDAPEVSTQEEVAVPPEVTQEIERTIPVESDVGRMAESAEVVESPVKSLAARIREKLLSLFDL
jgi:hypothetical protein